MFITKKKHEDILARRTLDGLEARQGVILIFGELIENMRIIFDKHSKNHMGNKRALTNIFNLLDKYGEAVDTMEGEIKLEDVQEGKDKG